MNNDHPTITSNHAYDEVPLEDRYQLLYAGGAGRCMVSSTMRPSVGLWPCTFYDPIPGQSRYTLRDALIPLSSVNMILRGWGPE